MRRSLATFALLFAWLCANGAVWDAMQAVAWTRMFAGYSETMTVTAALKETFDPSKPCTMCVAVAKAKDAATKDLPSAGEKDGAKFVLALQPLDAPVFVPDPAEWSDGRLMAGALRTEQVPVPPPRV